MPLLEVRVFFPKLNRQAQNGRFQPRLGEQCFGRCDSGLHRSGEIHVHSKEPRFGCKARKFRPFDTIRR